MGCTELVKIQRYRLNHSGHYRPPHPPLSATFGLRHRTRLSPAQGPGANYQRDESCPSLEKNSSNLLSYVAESSRGQT